MAKRRVMSSFLACRRCRRVYTLAELEREMKKRGKTVLTCPFCGSVDFTKNFYDLVLIIDPEKSKVAKYLKIIHPIMVTYTLE